MANGVLPEPPTVMPPTLITGTGTWPSIASSRFRFRRLPAAHSTESGRSSIRVNALNREATGRPEQGPKLLHDAVACSFLFYQGHAWRAHHELWLCPDLRVDVLRQWLVPRLRRPARVPGIEKIPAIAWKFSICIPVTIGFANTAGSRMLWPPRSAIDSPTNATSARAKAPAEFFTNGVEQYYPRQSERSSG